MSTADRTIAEKVRIAATTESHEPAILGCVDCEDKAPIRAIILYPNLGTPLILSPGQNKCSLFIAAESNAERYFGVVPPRELQPTWHFGNLVKETMRGAVFVDRHLRLYPIKEKSKEREPKDTMLFADGKAASRAMEAVDVWQVGRFRGGIMINRLGEPVAIVRHSTARMYAGLTHIYEIEIDLAKLPPGISLDSMHTFAWMVPVPETFAARPELKGVGAWEYQDQVILEFLDKQVADQQQSHYERLYEFDLTKPPSAMAMPPQKADTTHRLMAWHPVVRGKAPALKIGHLSDVHVNVRQTALAKSPAYLLELPGGQPAPGSPSMPPAANLCNSFIALHGLVEQFAKGGDDVPRADALVITGDLLDFNRNIDPDAVAPNSIVDQWKAFNVLNKVRDRSLYKRGLDDMLVFSLLRHAYRELNMPVFLTTGNHEAYQVPYGISPRQNAWVLASGVLENAGAFDNAPHGLRPVNLDAAGLAGAAAQYKALIAAGKDVDVINGPSGVYADPERASEFSEQKANDGIAADHNLTIYEACLAYGPTYGQVLTAKNYDPGQYDWFFTLFTPLSDWRHIYGNQCMVGLDWGSGEEFVNLSGVVPLRADKQGSGILPRATQAISDAQRALLDQSQRLAKAKYAAQTLVFSHFTFINYDLSVAFSDPDRQIKPSATLGRLTKWGENSGGWNFNNMGTCERNQLWFFENCVNQTRTGGVALHFSGHSHRAGVYSVTQSADTVHIVSAFDPGLQTTHPDNKQMAGRTRFIVSSCGGPIGVQNLNHEFGGWTLTPPSGTLYDSTAQAPFRQIAHTQGGAQPRLAVALDYMQISKVERVIAWERARGKDFFMIVGPKTHKLACIESVRLWGFDKPPGKTDATWLQFETELEFRKMAKGSPHETFNAAPQSGIYLMKIPVAQQEVISRLRKSDATRWFCEVGLRAPMGFPSAHFKLDPWFFPVDFLLRPTGSGLMPTLRRRPGEHGEVPDWTWLTKTFEGRYPDRRSATKVDR
ncbi:metallophosphoesterase [Cupriavidus sp. SW-Y-13]|uniref:metallophosphoesterase n=1 Tax=Cupriavidus sp. SW-Y-13 TaxID=2653854 RepID=UPI001366528C|nr:metallophosphoesterase [Cupriavidus sp. SW-Y-13]MWL87333.1 hypothetical protein [Cupriavidus sp. SW-Y-13]